MAKLTILLAAFLALLLLLVADASNHHRTRVVIDNADEENPRGSSCMEQIRRQQNLRNCQDYMMQECRSGRYGRDGDYGNQEQHLRMCCQQLEKLDSRCRCEGLEEAVRQQQRRMGQMEMREVMECASDIPSRCGMSPGECRFERYVM